MGELELRVWFSTLVNENPITLHFPEHSNGGQKSERAKQAMISQEAHSDFAT